MKWHGLSLRISGESPLHPQKTRENHGATARITSRSVKHGLGDPPLVMAFLDRVVYRATALKICGKSYRAHRAKKPSSGRQPDPL